MMEASLACPQTTRQNSSTFAHGCPAAGQFVPMQQRGTVQGLTGALHLIEGAMAMLMVLAAMGFAGTALGGRFRLDTLATIVVVLVFGAWSGMEAPRIEAGLATPWVGVKERIFWYAYQLWFAVLALVLLREGAGDRGKVEGVHDRRFGRAVP